MRTFENNVFIFVQYQLLFDDHQTTLTTLNQQLNNIKSAFIWSSFLKNFVVVVWLRATPLAKALMRP